jgi:hypothetical protein
MIQFITNMQIFFICKILDYKIEEWRIFLNCPLLSILMRSNMLIKTRWITWMTYFKHYLSKALEEGRIYHKSINPVLFFSILTRTGLERTGFNPRQGFVASRTAWFGIGNYSFAKRSVNVGIVTWEPQVVRISGKLVGIIEMVFAFDNAFGNPRLKLGQIVCESVCQKIDSLLLVIR